MSTARPGSSSAARFTRACIARWISCFVMTLWLERVTHAQMNFARFVVESAPIKRDAQTGLYMPCGHTNSGSVSERRHCWLRVGVPRRPLDLRS